MKLKIIIGLLFMLPAFILILRVCINKIADIVINYKLYKDEIIDIIIIISFMIGLLIIAL